MKFQHLQKCIFLEMSYMRIDKFSQIFICLTFLLMRSAMTPVTDFVILIYIFYEGPFDSIVYTYLGPKMIEKENA